MLIGRCQRSNDVIEPRLKTQWFVRTGPLAEAALAATRTGGTQIVPARFEKVWEHWMTEHPRLERQPAAVVGPSDPGVVLPGRPRHRVGRGRRARRPATSCGRPAAELTQDPDIFDTWFSSGLWPFSTLGWPDETPDLRRYYPTSVMETGYDIIFFWVARMMMLGHPPGRRGAVPHGLPARASSGTRTARRCRRRRATSSTRSRRSTARAPTRSGSR